MKEPDKISVCLGALMCTDPDKTLHHHQHQHLLLVDPVDSGEGPLTNKQVWISRVGVAILTKEKASKTTTSRISQTDLEQGTNMDKRTPRLKEYEQE